MKKVFFSKFSGTGNDFILIDKKLNHDFVLKNFDIVSYCRRRTGIGADGVLIIDDHEKYDFELEYYNSDGSTGMLCGNGARCAVYYVWQSNRLKNNFAAFINNGVEYSGEVIGDNLVKLDLMPPEKLNLDLEVKAYNQLINASFVHTGSPYIIIESKDILADPRKKDSSYTGVNEVPLEIIGSEIRWLKEFQPEGTNVCIIDLPGKGVHIRSFEKGVEGETLSCGTGAVAAAVIASCKDKLKPPVEVYTKRGDVLKIDFKHINNKIDNITLTGKVREIFSGKVLI
ncbi:MAG: diaminopimelate epimerase [Ignavibacteria bacterium]|jgi:diaminopimelate epimerase